jgi:hypothetical protein
LDAGLVRPSRSVFDAAEAAVGEVIFFGATCDNVLPAADLEAAPVFGLASVLDAAFAAGCEVIFEETGLGAAADCARAANVSLATMPLFERAVAL